MEIPEEARKDTDNLVERLSKRIRVGLLIHLAVEFVIPAELHECSVALGAAERNVPRRY